MVRNVPEKCNNSEKVHQKLMKICKEVLYQQKNKAKKKLERCALQLLKLEFLAKALRRNIETSDTFASNSKFSIKFQEIYFMFFYLILAPNSNCRSRFYFI